MTNRKSIKRSLIASILAICLSVTSLVGTTFAWFTDSVTSSGNKIVAGTLKVDLEVLDDETNTWSSVKEKNTPIFNYVDWEPGYTELRMLKVENEGSLALKWKAKFASADKLTALADVIDVYVYAYGVLSDEAAKDVKYPTSRDLETLRYEYAGTLGSFVNSIEATTHGKLQKGESAYLGLALQMRTSAGNEYQDMDLGGVFDIQIVAAQLASEDDSYGKDYDAGAEYDGEITNAAGLKAAFAAGGEYTLMNDITLDGAAEVPAGKTVKLDLAGNNITSSATAITNNGTLTVTNNVAVASTLSLRAAVVTGGIDTSSAKEQAPAIYNKGKLVVNGGTYVGSEAYYTYALDNYNGEIEINDANVIGGFGGVRLSGSSKGVINGGSFAHTTDPGSHIVAVFATSELTVNGGSFNGHQQTNDNWQYTIYAVETAKVDINGGAFTAHTNAAGTRKLMFNVGAPIKVYGGTFDIDVASKFLAAGLKTVSIDGIYYIVPDTTVEADLYISNLAQLKAFADNVNGGNSYKGKTIALISDIDLENMEWAPIGNGTNKFSGTFDGQEHTISNLNVTAEKNAGFFGYAQDGGNVKNLKINGATVSANDYAGAIIGRGYTDIVNCHVENAKITVTPYYDSSKGVYDGGAKAGAIMGQLLEGSGNTLISCSVKNVEIIGYRDLGGVLGMAQYSSTVSGCYAENVAIKYISVDGVYDDGVTFNENAGAIVGRIHKDAIIDFTEEQNSKFSLVYEVASLEALQNALDTARDGDIIEFANDITGDVVAVQKPDVKITVDGKDFALNGTITVDGKSSTIRSAALTVKNVKFVADTVKPEACINMGDGTTATRYICNLTVQDCYFNVPGKVAIKSYGNGDKNLKIIGCVVESGMHSLLQVNNVGEGLLVENCKIYSKNGINTVQSEKVEIIGCEIDVLGYTVRFGASSGGTGAAETYKIENCTLKSKNDDGDAVVILRGTADNSTLTINNTTLEGNPQITNTATNAIVIIDGKCVVSSSEELAKAIEKGVTNLSLMAGTYKMPYAAQGKTLTLSGAGADTVIEVVPAGQSEAGGQLDYSLDGSKVTFNDLTIKTNSQLYAGFARLSATYNNCVIQNTYNLGVGTSEFNECTFNITNEYLRVGGAYSATFNKCTFNTDGRAILVYQDGTTNAQTVTVKDCTFKATAAANTWNGIHVAAVSYDGSQGGTYVVNFEGTNTVDSNFNGLWQIKAGEANVTVNGLN